ncbi:hypothetical protein EDD29_4359 [Actinocorallia herbida]|uniref:Uncharacterized protein n=1 Tax=Actinocorallia herbida TaxID=58109 RepID=A0A3N1CZT0_9ACTN|nr:hypothetical protein [Actinocorallia herbida]ROO86779.1 hypothetical protein EDD29_4359 [Actinocorallia herbida]
MPPVDWTRLGSPGEVWWAHVGDASTIAVGTFGGHLYLRERAATGWRWVHLGVPPGVEKLLNGTLVPVDGADGLQPMVVDFDAKVWLHRKGATPTPWTGISGPPPGSSGLGFFLWPGDIQASAIRRNTLLKHTLVITNATIRPWIRQGLDPDDSWFPIPLDADWVSAELAVAAAPVTPGAPPQPHIFAVTLDPDSLGEIEKFQIAVHENSLWTWITPGGQAPFLNGLSATSFRDGSGRLQACAVVTSRAVTDTVKMLVGSGRDWQWSDLGRPNATGGPDFVDEALVAVKGSDPGPGEPVVLARADDRLWSRTPAGAWKDLGSTLSDGGAVRPVSAVEVAAAEGQGRVLTVGIAENFDLWAIESGTGEPRWERHGQPGPAALIVGAYDEAPDPNEPDFLPIGFPVISEDGALWNCRLWGDLVSGGFATYFSQALFWTDHGTPAPNVTCTAGVGISSPPVGAPSDGTSIFVIGSDGHLWARKADAGGWTWVDHGAPAGAAVTTGVAPISPGPSPSPLVHVLADDGRLWTHSSAGGPAWTDHEAPPGQLIFAVIGAQPLTSAEGDFTVAAAVTADGHLWINVYDGSVSDWIDLGTPTPTERIGAGIGVSRVSPADSLEIAVVGSSEQVWTLRWSLAGSAQWTARGRPADARPRAPIGTLQDASAPATSLVLVVGIDHQIWRLSTGGGGWSRWDPRSPTTKVLSGKAQTLVHTLPCAVILDGDHRVHVVTSAIPT